MNESDGKISVKCFSRFAIFFGSGKQEVAIRNEKARELIAFLLMYKDKGIDKATICKNVWGDRTIVEGMDCLYKTINFIKHIDIPLHLESSHEKIWICTDNLDIDLLTFEQLYQDSNQIDNKERMISLYKGPLFNDETYAWSCTWEAFYDLKYLEILNEVCDFYKKNDNYEKEEIY